MLAAIAGRTQRIHLGTAVTVLSSDDPVRLFQRFSTLNAASSGRAKVILGRGSFTESYPLFGYKLEDYDRLFEEKLELFTAPAAAGQRDLERHDACAAGGPACVPHGGENGPLTTWIGVAAAARNPWCARPGTTCRWCWPIIGGDPGAVRAPMSICTTAPMPRSASPVRPIAVHSPGYVADTDAQAREELFPDFKRMRDQIGRERGWPPMGRAEVRAGGGSWSLYVGSPDTVARKIAATVKTLRVSRFQLKYSAGPLSHERLMRSINLFGTEVIPRVRAMLA